MRRGGHRFIDTTDDNRFVWPWYVSHSFESFWFYKSLRIQVSLEKGITMPETNRKSTWKWMVEILASFEMAYFQGRTVIYLQGVYPDPILFWAWDWDRFWMLREASVIEIWVVEPLTCNPYCHMGFSPKGASAKNKTQGYEPNSENFSEIFTNPPN